MPDISEFCPHCGRPVREGNVFAPDSADTESGTTTAAPAPRAAASPARPAPTATVLPTQTAAPPTPQVPVQWNDRVPGALAYFTFIPALVFLFAKPFQKRKFVRFHAVQSLLFWGGTLLFVVLGVVASMFGWLFLWMLTGALLGLALFFTWLLLSIKALQGEWFALPLLGSFAEQLDTPGPRPLFGR